MIHAAKRPKGTSKASLVLRLEPISLPQRDRRGRRKRPKIERVDCITAAKRRQEQADAIRAREHSQRYVLPKIARDIGQVEMLHRRKAIDDQQRSAAERFASLYEQAGFKPRVTAAYMGGVTGGSGFPGHGPKAPEFLQALAAVGESLSGLVRAVVIEDVSATTWARANDVPEDAGIVLLRAGLDNLCFHFKYKTPPRSWIE